MTRTAAQAITDNLDLVVDRRVGIVPRLAELARELAAPDFVHYAAETCDPAALGGEVGPFIVAAAGDIGTNAADRALGRAVARYAASLYDRAGLPLASWSGATFRCLKPATFALYSAAQYGVPGFPYVPFTDDTPVRWTGAIDLATGEATHVPAALTWYPYRYLRSGGDLPIAPPGTGGLASGDGVAAAALAGLYDVVMRDSLAIFWETRTAPPKVRLDTLQPRAAALAGRFLDVGDDLVLLDATTDNRIPVFIAAAASDQPERPAHAFGSAANLDPAAAIEDALAELAEARRLSQWTKRTDIPPGAGSGWEDVIEWRDHLAFAADHRNRDLVAFLLASEDERNFLDYDDRSTNSAERDLEECLGLVIATRQRAYAANLTPEDLGALGISVVRVFVPGYQPLFTGHRVRALGGERLHEVPQRLGYRGLGRDSIGNPAPHPFLLPS